MFGLFNNNTKREKTNTQANIDIDGFGNLSDEYLDLLNEQQLDFEGSNEWSFYSPIELLALNLEKLIDFRAKHYLEIIDKDADNLAESIKYSIECYDSETSEPLYIDQSINEFNDNLVNLRTVFEEKLKERRDKLSEGSNLRNHRIEILLYERLIYHCDGISMKFMPYLKEYDKRYNPNLTY